MSTNAQPRVLGRWCRTSRWCTLVHARQAFVVPADATSASCDVRSRDDSGRQRGVTSASRNVERRHVSERRDVSEPQRQRGAPSASHNVKRATSSAQSQARNVKRATSSAQRQTRNVKCARGRGATSSAQGQVCNVGAALRQARNVKNATWARRYVKRA